LRSLDNLTVHLRCRSLIKTSLVCEVEDPNCFKESQCAKRVRIGGIFRLLKGDHHVALRRKIVDLVGLYVLDHPDQTARVRHVAIVKKKTGD